MSRFPLSPSPSPSPSPCSSIKTQRREREELPSPPPPATTGTLPTTTTQPQRSPTSGDNHHHRFLGIPTQLPPPRRYYDLKVEGGAEAVKGSRMPAETSPVATKRLTYPRRDRPS
ncbi:hypothetical protein RHGRI_003398 [Rhododendron griersonianum]|uniref:Uncharacterized protein n=1 Tax=Rhododendron griersonianum TaxID=479676 RepID=A0AAV6L6T3_9ERIC|nr:hypothetical protein RHGRI_003398 [Rhododendron griersonianum]